MIDYQCIIRLTFFEKPNQKTNHGVNYVYFLRIYVMFV